MSNKKERQNMKRLQINYARFNADQHGLVSFMVTLILMVVITLIVIGFTQVTIRSQNEALDRQLSEQAFYAAESGVNQVVGIVKDNLTSGNPIVSQTDCDDASTPYITGKIGSSSNVSVTCLMVDPVVEDIRLSADQMSSTITRLETANGASPTNLNRLDITWDAQKGIDGDITKCDKYSTLDLPESIESDCGFGMLRLDLMHFQDNNVTTGENLADRTITFYLKPTNVGPTSITVSGSAQKAYRGNANCSTGKCKFSIDFNSGMNTKKFYARVSMLYRDTPLVVFDGDMNGSVSDASFKDAQIMIDSTGQARDVLRRVQVRYPIGVVHTSTPPSALESEAKICKRFTHGTPVSGAFFVLDGECTP